MLYKLFCLISFNHHYHEMYRDIVTGRASDRMSAVAAGPAMETKSADPQS